MASKNLFAGQKSVPRGVQPVNTVNEAGGVAYSYSNEHALAQYALTGTFNGTFYATDADQLQKTLDFASKCDPSFVAKTAVYARQAGYMKDMPSFLLSYIAAKDTELLKKAFPRVVDNPKMVRNFVQMIRSGQVGRKSFGSAPKRLISNYLNKLSDDQLFRADVGNDPSLQDIIKMIRPAPANKQRAALYGYLIDKQEGRFGEEKFKVFENLTDLVREYEEFKKALLSAKTDEEKNRLTPPNVPFLMLTALPLTKQHWKVIAARASWTQLRMNLNSFAKHGVFEDKELTKSLAEKLASKEEIHKARAFPYQLFAAHTFLDASVPQAMHTAIIDAADIAVDNVPAIDGDVVIAIDVSGSMHDPVTGHRGSATSKIRCIDVAALIAAAVLRKNPNARIIPFSDSVVHMRDRLNPRDSVLTNAKKLASLPAGGTNCSAPLVLLNQEKARPDLIWFVSDNQSWIDGGGFGYGSATATGTMAEFSKLKRACSKTRMVRNDMTPYSTTQVNEHPDVMNVGGFSDTVFDVVASFAKGGNDSKTLVDTIRAIEL